MVNHGLLKSRRKPEKIHFQRNSVFIADNINEVKQNIPNSDKNITYYTFNLTEYSTGEYITLLENKNSEFKENITTLELAIAEIYEDIKSGNL